MQVSDIERIFYQLLASISTLSGSQIDDDLMGFYDENLQPYGYDRVNKALQRIIDGMRPGDRLPSITDIKKNMDDGLTDSSKVQIALTDIIRMVGAKGHTWDGTFHYDGYKSFDEALDKTFGPIGVEVVRRFGGWRALCEAADESYRNMTAFRSQLRDMIGAVNETVQRTGEIGAETALPAHKETTETIQMLANACDITKKVNRNERNRAGKTGLRSSSIPRTEPGRSGTGD